MPRIPKPDGPPGAVWFGGDVERIRLWFRILGDDLDPDEITILMRRAPTSCRRKGDRIPRSSIGRQARTGSWIIEFEPSPVATVDEAIADLLAGLPTDESLWGTLTSRYKVDLICDAVVRGVNQGFELTPAVIQLLALRHITFGVDIFTEIDEEQAQQLKNRFDK